MEFLKIYLRHRIGQGSGSVAKKTARKHRNRFS